MQCNKRGRGGKGQRSKVGVIRTMPFFFRTPHNCCADKVKVVTSPAKKNLYFSVSLSLSLSLSPPPLCCTFKAGSVNGWQHDPGCSRGRPAMTPSSFSESSSSSSFTPTGRSRRRGTRARGASRAGGWHRAQGRERARQNFSLYVGREEKGGREEGKLGYSVLLVPVCNWLKLRSSFTGAKFR